MADEKTFPVKIIRNHYTFRGRSIPKGSVVEVTEAQFKAMTRMDPPYAERVKAAEAKEAGASALEGAGTEVPAPKGGK